MTSAIISRASAPRSVFSNGAFSNGAFSNGAFSNGAFSNTDVSTVSAATSAAMRVDPRGERLWRVSTTGFAVVGHVELLDTAGGDVFLAKRYSPTYARFVDHGRFWTLEDAVACLRTGG